MFTIITPNLNGAAFLRECLESVALQEGVECEHWVIDGGSVDGSEAVVRGFPGVKWLREPDEGMADAINKGFDRARGDWVMWLNGDDCLLPGALAKVRAFAAEHPEADVIHGDCRFVGSDRTLLRRKYDHPMDEVVLVFAGCWVPSTATFFHRRLLDAGQRLDRRFKNSMDWEFYLRLLRSGYRFCYLPEALADFRWHEGNLTVLHDARRRAEDRDLQRAHLAARGWPAFLGWRPVLALLRWVFKLRRTMLRWRTHRRLG